MTKKAMGYPLPSGDAFTDELACMMVFIPDKDAYRQAFFGAYFYLSTHLAWERDVDKRGKDAARAWRLAVEATMECIEMNVCETIVELLTDIRTNTAEHCCEVVDISHGDRFTDEVEDEVGDVPQNVIDAGYAEDAADWAGFADYKCMIANVMVDNMTAQLEQILGYMVPPSAILGGLPTLVAVASTIFIDALSVLVYAIMVGASVSFRLHAALAFLAMTGLEALIDDMATHRDALVCAIYEADGSEDAIVQLRIAVTSLFSETRAEVLNNLNLDAQMKALYAGRHDEQDIAQILADKGYDVLDYVCDCEEVEPLTEGANLEMVRIQEVNYHTDNDPIWTVHAIDDEYGNGVEFDVSHNDASGHYFYIDLTLKPSVYHTDPDVSFRGISYLLVSTATGTEYSIDAVGAGNIQIADDAGFGRRTSWFGLHSEPYAGFKEDCEDILENTYYAYSGTDGLDQLPDQLRTISLRFVVPGVQRCFLRVHTAHFAINYTP